MTRERTKRKSSGWSGCSSCCFRFLVVNFTNIVVVVVFLLVTAEAGKKTTTIVHGLMDI